MATARALADPVKMIRNGAPRLIQNDAELDQYNQALLKLLDVDEPTPEESAAIDLLTLLIERYDDKHHSIPNADPVSVIRFMMDQHGLQQKDLVSEFGTKSIVSEVLSGKRKLTVDHIQKLSWRFHVSPEVFLASDSVQAASKRRADVIRHTPATGARLRPSRKLSLPRSAAER
jgi:HTH-type transcriptional regulator/antitoxin HigA